MRDLPVSQSASSPSDRHLLVHARNPGRFWKPCPGTTAGYVCCGYQILTPMTGCGMYCRYCILQAYFEHRNQVVFDNRDDMVREIEQGLADRRGVVRFGTGEFADSLYAEERLGLSREVAAILAPYPNVVVEFKTKCANVEPLAQIRDPSKVVVGFSLNTPWVIETFEQETAPLEHRLRAARKCADMGFSVAIHFDPMIRYERWEQEYRELVRRVFAAIGDSSRIAWWSMGAFRTVPALKTILRERGEHLPLFDGEMVLGEDRKYRYFRPLRVEMYGAIDDEVGKHDPGVALYLCMESPEVWRDSGMERRIPDGLCAYLDKSACRILGTALPEPARRSP